MVKQAYRKRKGWYLLGFYSSRTSAENAADVMKARGYNVSVNRIEAKGKLAPAIYQVSFKKRKRRRKKPC